jgi:hypothetical protein
MNSIRLPEASGQLAAEIYNHLLKSIAQERANRSPTRHCDWRFKPPQRPPQLEARLRAYWGEVFKDRLAALDAEWAEPRAITPVTSDSTSEGNDVFIQQIG